MCAQYTFFVQVSGTEICRHLLTCGFGAHRSLSIQQLSFTTLHGIGMCTQDAGVQGAGRDARVENGEASRLGAWARRALGRVGLHPSWAGTRWLPSFPLFQSPNSTPKPCPQQAPPADKTRRRGGAGEHAEMIEMQPMAPLSVARQSEPSSLLLCRLTRAPPCRPASAAGAVRSHVALAHPLLTPGVPRRSRRSRTRTAPALAHVDGAGYCARDDSGVAGARTIDVSAAVTLHSSRPVAVVTAEARREPGWRKEKRSGQAGIQTKEEADELWLCGVAPASPAASPSSRTPPCPECTSRNRPTAPATAGSGCRAGPAGFEAAAAIVSSCQEGGNVFARTETLGKAGAMPTR